MIRSPSAHQYMRNRLSRLMTKITYCELDLTQNQKGWVIKPHHRNTKNFLSQNEKNRKGCLPMSESL